MKRKPIKAITIRETGIARSIISAVEVKDFFSKTSCDTCGIWDSGATNSVITKSTAQLLGLPSIGQTRVRGVHGVRVVNVYYVQIRLKGTDIVFATNVTECDELSNDKSIGMLLGMNIITKGDFSITNYRGKTTMSFRVPSQHRIDYLKA